MSTEENNSIRIAVVLNILFTILIALKGISPYCSRNLSSMLFFYFFIGWIITACMVKGLKVCLGSRNVLFIASYMLLLWQILMRAIGNSSLVWANYIFRIALYALPLISAFIIHNYNLKEKRILIVGLIILSFYNIIDNIILWQNNPSAFVGLYFTSYVSNRLTNAGGTEFNAFCMFLLPSLFLLYLREKRKPYRMLNLSLIIITCYTLLFVCPHATALLLSVALVFILVYILLFGSNKRKLSYAILVGIMFSVLLALLLPIILNWLADVVKSTNVSTKISTIVSVLQGTHIEDTSGSFVERWHMAQVSINTFLGSFSNFLFGIGEHGVGQSLSDFTQAGIGGHSEYLDYLAKYGVIGSLFMVLAVRAWIRYIVSLNTSENIKAISKIVCVLFVVYSFLNKSYKLEIFVPLFVVFPIILDYVSLYRQD